MKPVSVVQRERAWQRIKEIAAQVVDMQPDANEDVTAEEERIAEEVVIHARQAGDMSLVLDSVKSNDAGIDSCLGNAG